MFSWQPIETAPKDGRNLLLGFAGCADMDFYRWVDDLRGNPERPWENWSDCFTDPPNEPPTHWMDITPPKTPNP